jgi:hypothetical protein
MIHHYTKAFDVLGLEEANGGCSYRLHQRSRSCSGTVPVAGCGDAAAIAAGAAGVALGIARVVIRAVAPLAEVSREAAPAAAAATAAATATTATASEDRQKVAAFQTSGGCTLYNAVVSIKCMM